MIKKVGIEYNRLENMPFPVSQKVLQMSPSLNKCHLRMKHSYEPTFFSYKSSGFTRMTLFFSGFNSMLLT